MAALRCQRLRIIADGQDHGIGIYRKALAVFIFNNDAALSDLGNRSLEMDGHVIRLKEITQIAGIGKAYALCCDEVVLHFNDRRLLALQIQLVRDLTAGQTAADHGDSLAYLLLTEQDEEETGEESKKGGAVDETR